MRRSWSTELTMDNPMRITVPLTPDEEGMFGRQCPNEECKKYFKVRADKSFKIRKKVIRRINPLLAQYKITS